jgi:hypothetical protein
MPSLNHLLHTIDTVFSDPKPTKRRQIVSQSKLQKGDAAFSTTKRLLGWDVDMYRMTLQLPLHCCHQIHEAIHDVLHKKCVSIKTWQKMLSILRSTTPALYGAQHSFSLLQRALTQRKQRRLTITSLLRHTLSTWLDMAQTASSIPVPLHTVVPTPPAFVGATDASALGMGGWWTTSSAHGTPKN